MYPTDDRPDFGVFVRNQVDGLREQGVDCEVCFLSGRYHSRYVSHIPEIRETIRRFDPDLVHLHFSWSYIPFLFLSASRPMVVSFCGHDLLYNRIGGIHRLKFLFSKCLNNYMMPDVHHAIVKSPEMKRELRGYRIPQEQVSVVPNGVDLSHCDVLPRNEAKRKLNLDEETTYVLNLGNPEVERKRIGLARRVVERAQQRCEDEQLAFIAPYRIPYEEVPLYMNAADCYLLTSSSEGSPNVVKESLACGTPVVSTDVGDVRQRLDGLPACGVASDDPAKLARELVDCVDQMNDYERRVLRERVMPLSRTKVAQKIMSIYDRVLR